MRHKLLRGAVRGPRVYMLMIAAMAVAALAGVLAMPAYAADGRLFICKIAGTGVTTGTNFTFDAGGTTVIVPAGSCVVAGDFTQGTNVTVQETVPSGLEVSAISVSDSAVLVSSNLAGGSAVVGIGGIHNIVSFTNSVHPTAVTLRTFSARRTAHGVLLRWHTGAEVASLGFNVYREVGSRRVRVNPSLLGATARPSGSTYTLLDRAGTGAPTRYWLQSVELNGSRSWTASTLAR